jgi:hypothetical protein
MSTKGPDTPIVIVGNKIDLHRLVAKVRQYTLHRRKNTRHIILIKSAGSYTPPPPLVAGFSTYDCNYKCNGVCVWGGGVAANCSDTTCTSNRFWYL